MQHKVTGRVKGHGDGAKPSVALVEDLLGECERVLGSCDTTLGKLDTKDGEEDRIPLAEARRHIARAKRYLLGGELGAADYEITALANSLGVF